VCRNITQKFKHPIFLFSLHSLNANMRLELCIVRLPKSISHKQSNTCNTCSCLN
jgi:hypothetical protein